MLEMVKCKVKTGQKMSGHNRSGQQKAKQVGEKRSVNVRSEKVTKGQKRPRSESIPNQATDTI